MPPSNRISRAGAVILLILLGGYIEVGLLVGQGFVEQPLAHYMLVLSLVFPVLVFAGILWAIANCE